MFRTKLTPLAVVLGLMLIFAACSQAPAANPEDDKAKVVKLALQWALLEKHIPDQALLSDPSNVPLSLENIDQGMVPQLDGVSLMPLTSEEVQDKADEEGDFLHIRFDSIEVDSRKASVSIVNVWASSRDSNVGYLSGGGCTLSFEKENDEWKMNDSPGPCWIS